MDCPSYHDNIWLPFSHSIDRKIHKHKILRKIKKAFDVHFSILALLGVIATPEGDLDCYLYMFKRANPHKYQHLTWKQRKKLISYCIKEIRGA